MKDRQFEYAVSVVVPAYNSAQFIEECLDSLVNQTLESLQVVVVNDGSTDSTQEIIDSFVRDYPGKVKAFAKDNGGQATARNLALDNCDGEYIGFMDSDDLAMDDMFEKMYVQAKRTEADRVSCGFVSFKDVDGKRLFSKPSLPVDSDEKRDMYRRMNVNSFNYLYKASVLNGEEKIRFPEGVVYEDVSFYLKATACCQSFFRISAPLAYRRWREGSTCSHVTAEKTEQIFPVIDDAVSFYRENEAAAGLWNEMEYACVKLLFCSNLGRIGLLAGRREKARLITKTVGYVKEKFPDRGGNPCFTGLFGFYLKHANVLTSWLVLRYFAHRHIKAMNLEETLSPAL